MQSVNQASKLLQKSKQKNANKIDTSDNWLVSSCTLFRGFENMHPRLTLSHHKDATFASQRDEHEASFRTYLPANFIV